MGHVLKEEWFGLLIVTGILNWNSNSVYIDQSAPLEAAWVQFFKTNDIVS